MDVRRVFRSFRWLAGIGLTAAPAFAQTIAWTSATSGTWETAGNWTPATVPNNLSAHRASISVAGSPYTITASGGSIALAGLDLASSAARVVFNFASTSNALTLGTGTSTWSAGNVEFRTSSGLSGSGAANTTITAASGVELLFSTVTNTRSLSSLTFNNSGTLRSSSSRLALGSINLNNQSGGLVHADGAEIAFQGGTNLVNAGILRATGASGLLRFSTTFTSANLGTVQLVSGGRAVIDGTINNAAATLAAPSGGSYELLGGTISGGTIAPGALTFTNSSGTLSGVTWSGDFTMPASVGVFFNGGTNFTGVNATIGSNTYLYWQQAATLVGKALTFNSNGYIYVNGANNTLTLDAASTAGGQVQIYSDGSNGTAITNQGNITHTSGTGSLYARSFSNTGNITSSSGGLQIGSSSAGYNSTNTGNITASGSSAIVYVDGNVANTGTLRAENSGLLAFRGPNTTANLGNIVLSSGGRARIDGTLNNAAATLNAPSGGVFELHGGTISGGTIAPGALTFTNSGGTLSGATWSGDFTMPANVGVFFNGGTSFTGVNATIGSNTYLYWQQAATLVGKALTFNSNGYIYVNGVNNTLTLDAASTAGGQVQIYSDGSNGTAITNQGNITHTSGTGYLYARSFSNTGNITSSSGGLQIGSSSAGYNSTNTGNITASGSSAVVYLDGNVANTGTLRAQNSGLLAFRGPNTTANLGNIVLSSGGRARIDGTLNNAAATLNAPSGGVFELHGGTISGGTIAPGALTFTNSGGTLSGATWSGDFTMPANVGVFFNGGTSFTGVNATIGSNTYLYWQQAATLVGKALTFNSNGYIYVNGVNNTLTLDAASTAGGQVQIYSDGNNGTAITNQGNITHTSGTGYLYARSFSNAGNITSSSGGLQIGSSSAGYNSTNTGNITASGSSAIVYLDGNVANTGTLRAQNSGILAFRGPNTTANLGNIVLSSGGRARIEGTLNNTGNTLAAPTGGVFELGGGTITGGNIAAGALVLTSNFGTLNQVTYLGDFGTPPNTGVGITGGTTFTGANALLGNGGFFYWQQVDTLVGKAITFSPNSYIYVSGVNNALTLDPTTTASGTVQIYTDGNNGTAVHNQGNITHTSGTGYIYGRAVTNSGNITNSSGALQIGSTSAGYNSTNTGNITATGGAATVYLDGNVTNTGTLRAQNSGQLRFRGPTTTANLGSIVLASGGRALLEGTLNNASATLTAPSGGVFELAGGTVLNGVISAGALTFTSSAGTLNGVALTGDLTLPASSGVYLAGNTSIGGANVTLGNGSFVHLQQDTTLTGKTLTFGPNAYLYLSGPNRQVTLGAGTTASGQVEIYADGNLGSVLTNQATITHTSGTGYLYARNFTNAGAITASGGTLNIGTGSTGYQTHNASGGTLTLSGGNVSLQTPSALPILNDGLINVQSGTLFTAGSLTNVSGTITGAGTINGGLNLAGGTLSPGNSIGTMTFIGGVFAVTQPTTLLVELGGSSSDRLVFQSPSGAVSLGGGLLSLSLTLLSAPTPNTDYQLINITSGGSGIAGTFAGLPSTGSAFTANYLGTPYVFTIAYQTNAVVLHSIPEPETYAFLALGLPALWLYRRRSTRR